MCVHCIQLSHHSPDRLLIIYPLAASEACGDHRSASEHTTASFILPYPQLTEIFRMFCISWIKKHSYRTEQCCLAESSRSGDQCDLRSFPDPLGDKMRLIDIKLLSTGKVFKILIPDHHLGREIWIVLKNVLQSLHISRQMLFLFLQLCALLKFHEYLLPLGQFYIMAHRFSVNRPLDIWLFFPFDLLIGQGSLWKFFQSPVDLFNSFRWICGHNVLLSAYKNRRQLRNSFLRYEYYEKLTISTKTRFRYVSLATVLRSQSQLTVVPAF